MPPSVNPILQMINGQPEGIPVVTTAAYMVRNYTDRPIWISDGYCGVFKIRPMRVYEEGGTPLVPTKSIGGVWVERWLEEPDGRPGNADQPLWVPFGTSEIGRAGKNTAITNWSEWIPELNAAVFGQEDEAVDFACNVKTYNDLCVERMYNDHNKNQTNFGVINCTGRKLYQLTNVDNEIITMDYGMDDTRERFAHVNYSDTINTEAYLKIYRYHTDVDQYEANEQIFIKYSGKVIPWDTDTFNSPVGFKGLKIADKFMLKHGMVYLSEIGSIFSENKEDLEDFLKTWGSLETWRDAMIIHAVAAKYQARAEEVYDALNHRANMFISVAVSIIGLQLVSSLTNWFMEKKSIFRERLKMKSFLSDKKERERSSKSPSDILLNLTGSGGNYFN